MKEHELHITSESSDSGMLSGPERDLFILKVVIERELPAEEVAREAGVGISTVYRTVRSWEGAGIVSSKAVDEGLIVEPTRNQDAEGRLRDAFPRLRFADVFSFEGCTSFVGERGYDKVRDNILHKWLGRAAAREIPRHIRRGDHIGVGGGRALEAFVKYLSAETDLSRLSITRLTSLSGGVPVQSEDRDLDKRYADRIATDLAAVLGAQSENEPEPYLWSPVCSAKPWKNSGQLGRDYLQALQSLKNSVPDIAIFGLGNLRHTRQYVLLIEPPGRISPSGVPMDAAQSIGLLLEEMNKVTKGIEALTYYSPVIEFLNNLQVVPVLPRNTFTAVERIVDELGQVEGPVENLSNCLFGTREDWLMDMPLRIGIAGGLYKAAHIHYAIKNEIVNYLITDERTAEEVLLLHKSDA